MIAAILFDLDETLFDRSGSLRLFLADQHGRHRALASVGQDTFVDRFFRLDRRGRVAKSVVYPQLLAALDIDDPALADTLFAEYQAESRRYARPFDGLAALLRAVGARGLRTAVVTNGQTETQSRTLRALGLDRSVDICLISEAEGVRKPDAEIFLRAVRRLAVAPSGCVFVGDSPDADILGAQAVGMKTIWFPNGAVWPDGEARRPDAQVSSLAQIADILNAWG